MLQRYKQQLIERISDKLVGSGEWGSETRQKHHLLARVIVRLFEDLYRPVGEGSPEPDAFVSRTIVNQFNRYYFSTPSVPWKATTYRGVHVSKAPTDLWIYQEIVTALRPRWIIETGTWHGGSAYYLADLCDLVGQGHVVSIDLAAQEDLPTHERVTYLAGSSIDPAIVARVKDLVDDGPVLVILDSDHSEAHVRAEIDAFAPLVTPGSYLIVEDTICNGNPALPQYGPGPMEAMNDFLASSQEFYVDESKHKYFLTFNPRGYLRRASNV